MARELPPILTGNNQKDLQRIRDYLVRIANQLGEASQAMPGNYAAVSVSSKGGKAAGEPSPAAKDIEDIRNNARQLRQLIIKTADDLHRKDSDLEGQISNGDSFTVSYADQKVEALSSVYVAQSEFGAYQEHINTQIETTAKGVVESYGYEEQINSAQDSIELLQTYYTALNGEIRRGIILDPDTGDYVTGIAISQNLQFTGEIQRGDDGFNYYYLNSGQTFGLYTSTGWQFWIDGHKKGWFSSTDGMLHVSNIVVENSLQIGAEWQIRRGNGEFEIAYIGS